MEIKDFKKRKQQLEHDIAIAISELLYAFEKETDCFPSEVNVKLFIDRPMGYKKPDYIVGKVTTIIDL